MRKLLVLFLIVTAATAHAQHPSTTVSPENPLSLQAAIDANPGRHIFVPEGDYLVDKAVRIAMDNTGLWGPGRIVQKSPDQNILEVLNAANVRIEGLTLTRAQEALDATKHGIEASQCRALTIDNVQVIDNRSQAGTIYLDLCKSSTVRNCLVRNYKRVGVDDRTSNELYGYAFKAIDGTGIQVTHSQGLQIINNRVVDDNLFPTRETKEKYDLGRLCEGAKPTVKGKFAPKDDYVSNWHQGSAITVTSPEDTNHVSISGNYIENAAQGIDMHTDNTLCSGNVIHYAFIGLKCMHGAKNMIISNNVVTHNDLWGPVMLPGVLSHPAQAAAGDTPAKPANFTRGNIIANNIFSDYGMGYESYNWDAQRAGVISLESGQLPENPIMTDVIVEGNIVYDTAREQELVDGVPQAAGPRYDWAVYLTPEKGPKGLLFRNNIFHPGKEGMSNVPLETAEATPSPEELVPQPKPQE